MNLDDIGPLGIWNRFDERWIVTRRAAQLFFVASLIVVALFPFFMGMVAPSNDSTLPTLFWGVFGVLGSISIFFLWIGMWRYWARADDSAKWMKRVWFVAMLVGFWYGSCLYCWCVYLPQVARLDRQRVATVPITEAKHRKAGVFGKLLFVAWLCYFLLVALIFAFPKQFAPAISVTHVASIMLILTSFGYAIVWLFRQGISTK